MLILVTANTDWLWNNLNRSHEFQSSFDRDEENVGHYSVILANVKTTKQGSTTSSKEEHPFG